MGGSNESGRNESSANRCAGGIVPYPSSRQWVAELRWLFHACQNGPNGADLHFLDGRRPQSHLPDHDERAEQPTDRRNQQANLGGCRPYPRGSNYSGRTSIHPEWPDGHQGEHHLLWSLAHLPVQRVALVETSLGRSFKNIHALG